VRKGKVKEGGGGGRREVWVEGGRWRVERMLDADADADAGVVGEVGGWESTLLRFGREPGCTLP
jgi:hypothetical protein